MTDAREEDRVVNTADQYLKAIYLVQREEGTAASTGAIANRLGVSPASANEMIGKLAGQDLLDHEKYKGVTLTDRGEARARSVLRTYCIIERFLVDVLEVDSFREEARDLESVIDETVAGRLDTIIDRRDECPDCFDPDTDMCTHLDAPVADD